MAVKIFFCYAREDEVLTNKLKAHLKPLQRQGVIEIYSSSDIPAGAEWERETNNLLNSSDIILLFASPDFMASDDCNIQMHIAVERNNDFRSPTLCYAMGILLRPVDWTTTELKSLPLFPKDKKPVTTWVNQDEGFHNVAIDIKEAIMEVRLEQCLEEGRALYKIYRFNDAINVYNSVIHFIEAATKRISREEHLNIGKGDALYSLNRYEEALEAYEQAITRRHNAVGAYVGKGDVLHKLNRYTEALAAYDTALQHAKEHLGDSHLVGKAYMGKANVLSRLSREKESRSCYAEVLYRSSDLPETMKCEALYRLTCYDEAMLSCEQALKRNPNDAVAYNWKGNLLDMLGMRSKKKIYLEILEAYEKSIQLNPFYLAPHNNKASILEILGRKNEALALYHKIIDLDPCYVLAYECRGALLESLKKYEQALSDFQYAHKLCPQSKTNIESIIRILRILGRSEETKPFELLLLDIELGIDK